MNAKRISFITIGIIIVFLIIATIISLIHMDDGKENDILWEANFAVVDEYYKPQYDISDLRVGVTTKDEISVTSLGEDKYIVNVFIQPRNPNNSSKKYYQVELTYRNNTVSDIKISPL